MRNDTINMLEWVNDYINEEINQIKRDREVYGNEYLTEELCMLENMTDEDKKLVAERVLYDDELEQKTNETIHYYLYH